ncbi:type II toxin-antitoxin system VapC family toxin [Pseudanabaena sp. PCC 6802]|uniref:type II toxin-antitoxin system VapC family toxin n=1 Tax=Pseudanabaena sp. PCC 6802 TaxID=118173 RepID=UPI00034D36C8|nr:type II toxin-antitoxin system VapC family toxin [Pseudanabaena sp. PCC 6802]
MLTIALDTNLIVRILTNDDPEQAKIAANLIQSDRVFIPKTVLLEVEWVLRYTYKLDRIVIDKAFRHLLGLPNLLVEDDASVKQAMFWYGEGLDFADALHLASSGIADRFATFDLALQKRARRLNNVIPVVSP